MVGVGKEREGREMEGQREEEVSGAGRKRREERRKRRARHPWRMQPKRRTRKEQSQKRYMVSGFSAPLLVS